MVKWGAKNWFHIFSPNGSTNNASTVSFLFFYYWIFKKIFKIGLQASCFIYHAIRYYKFLDIFFRTFFPFLNLVTFFTYAKNSTMCGSQDLKIRLSKRYTFLNFLISMMATICVVSVLVVKLQLSLELFKLIGIFYSIPSLLTLIFLFYDNLCCCCCACCLGAGEWTVFDPENPQAILVWKDGQIMDMEPWKKRVKEERMMATQM